MTPKDNIIETVPLSAIRKVIELDAQDARELKALAIELLDTVEVALSFFYNPGSVNPLDIERKYEVVIKRAKDIL